MSMPRSAPTCRPTTARRPTVPHPMTCPIATTTSTPMIFLPGSKDRIFPTAIPNWASATLPGQDEQHIGPLIVETYHLAGLDLQRTPVSGACISGSEPVRRWIIIISVERVAPLGVAGLVACEKMSAALQRAPDQSQNIGKRVPRNVQQAGIGPDGVIGLDRIEVVKQQRLDSAA